MLCLVQKYEKGAFHFKKSINFAILILFEFEGKYTLTKLIEDVAIIGYLKNSAVQICLCNNLAQAFFFFAA